MGNSEQMCHYTIEITCHFECLHVIIYAYSYLFMLPVFYLLLFLLLCCVTLLLRLFLRIKMHVYKHYWSSSTEKYRSQHYSHGEVRATFHTIKLHRLHLLAKIMSKNIILFLLSLSIKSFQCIIAFLITPVLISLMTSCNCMGGYFD